MHSSYLGGEAGMKILFNTGEMRGGTFIPYWASKRGWKLQDIARNCQRLIQHGDQATGGTLYDESRSLPLETTLMRHVGALKCQNVRSKHEGPISIIVEWPASTHNEASECALLLNITSTFHWICNGQVLFHFLRTCTHCSIPDWSAFK